MDYPIALILAIAAGREDDLLTQLAGTLDLDDGALRVTVGSVSVRFAYGGIHGEFSIPARPSSGTGQLWHLWIVQPYDPMPPSYVKAFRDRLAAWAAARQPTGGRWHLLGPYTPQAFRAAAPAALWDAARDAWWTIWRAESSAEGVAAQQAAGDGDLT